MTAVPPRPAAPDADRCRRVLHIDWEGDPHPVREVIGQCVYVQGHDGRHRTERGELW